MPILGNAHGQIALHALKLSPRWNTTGISLSLADAQAAYEGNEAHLIGLYRNLGGMEPAPKLAPHGVPWDQLMGTNLPSLAMKATGHSDVEIAQVIEEFLANLSMAASELASNADKSALISPQVMNEGVYMFLVECARTNIAMHVVTMTPTPIVELFANLLKMSSLVDSFQGCEQFSAEEFPKAKLHRSLWIEAARRKNLKIYECAIVEDSAANLASGIDSSAAAIVSLSKKGNATLERLMPHGIHQSFFQCRISGNFNSALPGSGDVYNTESSFVEHIQTPRKLPAGCG